MLFLFIKESFDFDNLIPYVLYPEVILLKLTFALKQFVSKIPTPVVLKLLFKMSASLDVFKLIPLFTFKVLFLIIGNEVLVI